MSMDILYQPAAIVGEAVAGQAAKVRHQCAALIDNMNTSTFDLMDCLFEIKTKNYYVPDFDTFAAYTASLNLKTTKAYYLVRIRRTMVDAGVTRSQYEPVGITKLRVIVGIKTRDSDGVINPIAVQAINDCIAIGETQTLPVIKALVDEFNGNVGDEAFEWLNIRLKKSAKEVVRQAFELIKLQLGSVSTDDEGFAKDASDGSALEKMSMDYLSDVNNLPDLKMMG